ncbi:hypothetical protein NT07LI_1856, partial [Listeria innocua FSL S4-378]
ANEQKYQSIKQFKAIISCVNCFLGLLLKVVKIILKRGCFICSITQIV